MYFFSNNNENTHSHNYDDAYAQHSMQHPKHGPGFGQPGGGKGGKGRGGRGRGGGKGGKGYGFGGKGKGGGGKGMGRGGGGGYGRGFAGGKGKGGGGGGGGAMLSGAEVAAFEASWLTARPLADKDAARWAGLGEALVASAALGGDKPPVLGANGETLRNRVEVRVAGCCATGWLLIKCNGVPDYAPRKISGGRVVESRWQGVTRGGRFDRNPNQISEQDYRFKVPLRPGAFLATPITATPMGPIGIALNGVPLYHGDMQFTNPMLPGGMFANQDESFDQCCGHPDGRGRYHYHQYPRCVVGASALGLDAPDALIAATRDDADLTAAPLAKALAEQIARGEPSRCIGIAFDGHPIMGPVGTFGGAVRLATSSYRGPLDVAQGNPTYVAGSGDLDECNGAVGADGVYRYYATVDLAGDDVVPVFPYLIGAYRSQPEVTNFPAHQRATVMPAGSQYYAPECDCAGK